jgi:hypothetical protein
MNTSTGRSKDTAAWLIGVAVAAFWLSYHFDLFGWFEHTATVQQVRSSNSDTKLWMNDGTIWNADVSTASLVIVGDDVRYEHVDGPQPGQSELCILIDKTRPGLNFMASRMAGDPNQPSCPSRNDQGSRVDETVHFDPFAVADDWTSAGEPPGRVTPEGSTCPQGYKPIRHRAGVDGNIRHIDCVPAP